MSAELQHAIINMQKLHTNLIAAQEQILTEAATAFVMNAFGHVPVQTGMARSSLQPLARALKTSIPLGNNKPTARKNPAKGEEQSKQAGFIWSEGTKSYFEWWTKVFHYFLNEQWNISKVPSSPWFSREKGTAEAIRIIRDSRGAIADAIKASISYQTRRV